MIRFSLLTSQPFVACSSLFSSLLFKENISDCRHEKPFLSIKQGVMRTILTAMWNWHSPFVVCRKDTKGRLWDYRMDQLLSWLSAPFRRASRWDLVKDPEQGHILANPCPNRYIRAATCRIEPVFGRLSRQADSQELGKTCQGIAWHGSPWYKRLGWESNFGAPRGKSSWCMLWHKM